MHAPLHVQPAMAMVCMAMALADVIQAAWTWMMRWSHGTMVFELRLRSERDSGRSGEGRSGGGGDVSQEVSLL